ncbi:MAG: type III pantothenate kinase [Deltaproteobacteria bacterium]|nr:type III pantothenate kinase [Deltaproteobacteria bacterium]
MKIGNSEVVAWNGGVKFLRFSSSKFSVEGFFKKLGKTQRLWVVGVVPSLQSKISQVARKKGIIVKQLKLSDIPVRPAYRKNLGIDRLLNVYAASLILKKRGGVVIDLGTAITVDFFKKKKNLVSHLGGWILPGPRLMAESLAAQTAKIPLVGREDLEKVRLDTWPKRTSETLVLGQLHLIYALFMEAERFAEKNLKVPHQLLVTGGHAAAFYFIRTSKKYSFVPYLGLKALKVLERKSSR